MECNKDEALRAKDIADKKLLMQDYHGAKRFVQKAQQLFPGLENLSQLFAVIDVHIAAQFTQNATHTDWYGILQVDATADEMLIKRQYKRLALLLHPDKNKSFGAEAAFKLVGEAFQVLSDKTKRMLHDTGRNNMLSRPSQNVNVSHPANVSHQAQNTESVYPNSQSHKIHINNPNGQYPPMPTCPPLHSTSFWTACPSCEIRYQYHKPYENHTLLCPNCRLPFVAKDINSVQGNGAAYGWSSHVGSQQQQPCNQHSSKPFGTGFSPQNGFTDGVKDDLSPRNPVYRCGEFSAGILGTGAKSTSEYVQQRYETWGKIRDEDEREKKRKKREEEQNEEDAENEIRKRERGETKRANVAEKQAQKAATKERKQRLKRYRSDSSSEDENDQEILEDMLSYDREVVGGVNGETYVRRSSRARRNVTYKAEDSDDEEDFLPSKKTRATSEEREYDISAGRKHRENSMMGSRGTSGIGVKGTEKKEVEDMKSVKPFVPAKTLDAANSEKCTSACMNNGEDQRSKIEESTPDVAKAVPLKEEGSDRVVDNEFHERELLEEEIIDLTSHSEESEPEVLYTVPDADFHNFDRDREEEDIKVGQTWALYGDKDGMPRYYARVKEVQSYCPFEVTITWLESHNLYSDQEELLKSDFAIPFGDFRKAESETLDSLNIFSHCVKPIKGRKGAIRIYPRKGDIWGLYRDWDPVQRTLTFGEAPRNYNMMEIMTEFNEQDGVVVKPLTKVQGFRTLFQHSEESGVCIPPSELLRFSHQVPAYKLRGDEALGLPENCWDLDPASVPANLLFPDSEDSSR